MTASQTTSLSLLDQLQDPSNQTAWSLFFSVYRPLIQRYLRNCGISPSDLEDVVQESLTELSQGIQRFQHNGRTGAFRKWMRTIVLRRAYRALEHRKRQSRLELEVSRIQEQLDTSFETSLDREHDQHVLNTLIEWIQPEFTNTTWRAFEMQVVEGKRPSEVAAALGCTPNSAILSKSRVLRRLRRLAEGWVEC